MFAANTGLALGAQRYRHVDVYWHLVPPKALRSAVTWHTPSVGSEAMKARLFIAALLSAISAAGVTVADDPLSEAAFYRQQFAN
jgi:hypothetical protein